VVSAIFINCPYRTQFSCSFGRGVGDRIISHGLWPPHSLLLTPRNFHSWGNVRDKVFRTNPLMRKSYRKIYKEKFPKFLTKNIFG
jgi:hypothetical protein